MKQPSSTKSQPEGFKEAARALGVDEDEAAFEEKLRKLAKASPEKSKAEKR